MRKSSSPCHQNNNQPARDVHVQVDSSKSMSRRIGLPGERVGAVRLRAKSMNQFQHLCSSENKPFAAMLGCCFGLGLGGCHGRRPYWKTQTVLLAVVLSSKAHATRTCCSLTTSPVTPVGCWLLLSMATNSSVMSESNINIIVAKSTADFMVGIVAKILK